jgi:hypothetical protein
MKLQGVVMNDQGLELAVPVGVSGAFLRDRKRFEEIRKFRAEFNRSCSMLLETEQKLDLSVDPEWLTAFEQRCNRRKRNLEMALIDEAKSLEEQRTELAARKEEARQKLLELEPHAMDDVRYSLVGCPSQNPYFGVGRTQRRQANPDVKTRNEAIDCLLDLPVLGICKWLDDTFPHSGNPAPQFPDTWFKRFGVSTFEQAYNNKKCKHLVRTMISKRRNKRQSP